jgi:hypothetical protein
MDHLLRKKRLATFPSPAGMSLTKLALASFPPWESLLSYFPAGKGMMLTFFTVYMLLTSYAHIYGCEQGVLELHSGRPSSQKKGKQIMPFHQSARKH